MASITARAALALGVSTALLAGGLSTASATTTRVLPMVECTTGSFELEVFSFNDFHGRIMEAGKLFTPVEQARAAGKNVLLLSNGDNIGGSTFESASQDDNPTLKILNAAKVDASATGNHEYDKGWSDLSGRVAKTSDFPYLAANVTGTDGKVPAPLKPYTIKTVNGVRVAVIGAVTGDLPSLVSPAGIQGLKIGDPVQAVNTYAKALSDGNEANGEAEVVIAEIHEGAANGKASAADNAATSAAFKSIYGNVDPSVDVVFNGHTHQTYTWTTSNSGVPLLQAGSYGEKLAQVTLNVNAQGGVCGTPQAQMLDIKNGAADTKLPAIAEIERLAKAAKEQADVVGAEVVASATAPISLAGGLMKPDQRDLESPMNNLVAQFFHEAVGAGDKDVIGLQNPGGTRAGFDKGDITLKEAALALPFANTIMTTQVTGEQFKKVLEQQWQRDAEGNVPSRAFLRLGVSQNVTYTYDETRAEGDRITSITINGVPMDMAKLYTVASGSFLIAGGDNFRELGKGTNTKDTGLVDLTAFVDWVKAKKTVSPSFAQQGVSVKSFPTTLEEGKTAQVTGIGVPKADGVAKDTLDSTGLEAVKNTTAKAYVVQGDKKVQVGTAAVVNGSIASMDVTLAKKSGLTNGAAILRIETEAGKTIIQLPTTLKVAAGDKPTKPGQGNQCDKDANKGSKDNCGKGNDKDKGNNGKGKGNNGKPGKLPSTGQR